MKIAQETEGISNWERRSILFNFIEYELSLFKRGLPDPDPRNPYSIMRV